MSARAWSVFWRTSGGHGCLPNAPALHARLRDVWAETARAAGGGDILDIAAGNGDVARMIRAADPQRRVVGVDYAAVGPDAERSGVRGNIDASALPFPDGNFAGVVSQFGIEYCGRPALAEAVRVLQRGGLLRFVCHHAASPAVAHNAERLAALRAMQAAGLFRLAAEVAAGRPEDAQTAAAIAAARQHHAAQSVCEELPIALGRVLAQPGAAEGVAAITAMALAEAERLAAMTAAALDHPEATEMAAQLASAGVAVEPSRLAADGDERPFAWLFKGRRA